MRFSGICLITDDVPGLAEYYARVLGATTEGDEWHMEVRTAEAGMTIFATQGMEDMAPGSTQGAGTGSTIIAFEVADVDTEYVRLKKLGVDFVKLPATHAWGSRSLWFRDPDGNIVDFYAVAAACEQ